MSIKLNQLNTQIAELQAEIALAEGSHLDTARILASSPTDPDALADSRATAERITYLRNDLRMLTDAKELAEEDARSERAQLARERSSGHLKEAKALAAKRAEIGKRIDAILAEFGTAMGEWRAVNDDLTNSVVSFYSGVMRDNPRKREQYFGLGGDLRNCCSNAVAAQVSQAMQGINVRSWLSEGFVQQSATIPESVAKDAARYIDGVILKLEDIAVQEGLPA